MIRRISFFAFFAALVFPGLVRANCLSNDIVNFPSLITWSGGSGVGYEVLDSTLRTESWTFQIAKGDTSGGGRCSWMLTVTAGQEGSYTPRRLASGANELDYNIYKEAARTNIIKDVPTATSSQVLSGTFGNGFQPDQSRTLYWSIPTLQFKLADTGNGYRDTALIARLYQGTVSSHTFEEEWPFTLRAKIPAVTDIALVDSGAGFNASDTTQTVDFASFSIGESLGFDLRVRSNSGYSITMTSQRHQVMKHSTLADTVPYSLTVNGVSKNLTSGTAVNVASSAGTVTGAGGVALPVVFTVGSFTNPSAGTYSDNITVTVAAN